MFFVVYVIQTNRYLVVPISWISSIDTMIEYFINHSVNSNHEFSFFWTDNPLAFCNNEISPRLPPTLPRPDYLPNIHAGSTSVFPAEGWYRCKIKRFLGELQFNSFYSNYSNLLAATIHNLHIHIIFSEPAIRH